MTMSMTELDRALRSLRLSGMSATLETHSERVANIGAISTWIAVVESGIPER